MLEENFPNGEYQDVPGLCKRVPVEDLRSYGWSLNLGRYVGFKPLEDDGVPFAEKIGVLASEFMRLDADASRLSQGVQRQLSEFGKRG